MQFEQWYEPLKAEVDQALKVACTMNKTPTPVIKEAMEYSLFAGGKRIRSILCVLAGELLGGNRQMLLECSTPLEILHTYSLIHDDLPCMDDSDLRRGLPTCHIRFGEAVATLAGDAMLTFAWEVLIAMCRKWGMSDGQCLQAVLRLSEAIGANGMIAGQVLDIYGAGSTMDEGQLRQMHLLKTGRLFEASMELGVILCSGQDSDYTNLKTFARHFGLLFQITDDLLDVQGLSSATGKPTGQDVDNQKATYPSILGLDSTYKLAQQELIKAKEALQPYPGSRTAQLFSVLNYLMERRS